MRAFPEFDAETIARKAETLAWIEAASMFMPRHTPEPDYTGQHRLIVLDGQPITAHNGEPARYAL